MLSLETLNCRLNSFLAEYKTITSSPQAPTHPLHLHRPGMAPDHPYLLLNPARPAHVQDDLDKGTLWHF